MCLDGTTRARVEGSEEDRVGKDSIEYGRRHRGGRW